jgi:four helix bundle protein
MVKWQEGKKVKENILIGYKKLIVYQKAKSLVIEIYKSTTGYPKTEIYSLVLQTRRAVISVCANIVEGYSKESSKEFARFLTISIGSITELEVFLDLSFELEFITSTVYNEINLNLVGVKKLLYSTRKAVRGKY